MAAETGRAGPWPELDILSLEVTARWQRPTTIRESELANVLRGGFGLLFRRLVCPPEWFRHECAPCPLYAQCPYGQIFSPSPPADATCLRKQADLPRPFVIRPYPSTRRSGLRPEQAAAESLPDSESVSRSDTAMLRFGVVLFGRAIDFLPHFVVTLNELSRQGLGPSRTPFTIVDITAMHPDGDEPLYDAARHEMRRPHRTISRDDLVRASVSPDLLLREVRFLTPTLLRTGSGVDSSGRRIPAREITGAPPFGVLIRRLRDRLSSLCAFFAPEPWQRDDFGDLGRLADEVDLIESHTAWEHRWRRSTRTGRSHELSGFIGTATYRFPTPSHLTALLPLLRYGELLHVGKHAVWGNGWLGLTCPRNESP
jgi:hypothetical protein